MEALSSCPLCNHNSFSEFLKTKDFFLTGKEFTIVKCEQCGFRFTNPRPGADEITTYYESIDYLSHSTESKELKTHLYKWIRKINICSKSRIVVKNSSGNKLLDIGCGTGEFLAFCRTRGMEVSGIEPGSKAREFASTVHDLAVFDESWLDHQNLPGFDIITLWHVLEHVHKLRERLIKIRSLLKPGGTLFLALPNPDSWDAKFYKEFWAAYDVPRHLYHFDRSSVNLLAEQNGFKPVEVIPMKWDAYYISLLSERYKNQKQDYLKALFNGFRSNLSGKKNNMNYSSLIYILK